MDNSLRVVHRVIVNSLDGLGVRTADDLTPSNEELIRMMGNEIRVIRLHTEEKRAALEKCDFGIETDTVESLIKWCECRLDKLEAVYEKCNASLLLI
jgi:hypothetical protein